MLVGGEHDMLALEIAVRSGLDFFEFDRDDLLGELPGIESADRFHMAVIGEFVLRLTGYIELLGHVLGGQPHSHVDLGLLGGQHRVRADVEARHRDGAHRLDAPGDDDVGAIGDNPLGADDDRLQAARAEAVDRLGRDLDRHSGPDGDWPGQVEPLRPLGHGAAHDDVIHPFRLQMTLDRAHQLPDDGRPHFIRSEVAGHSLLGAPDRRPRRGYNHGFTTHSHPPMGEKQTESAISN